MLPNQVKKFGIINRGLVTQTEIVNKVIPVSNQELQNPKTVQYFLLWKLFKLHRLCSVKW